MCSYIIIWCVYSNYYHTTTTTLPPPLLLLLLLLPYIRKWLWYQLFSSNILFTLFATTMYYVDQQIIVTYEFLPGTDRYHWVFEARCPELDVILLSKRMNKILLYCIKSRIYSVVAIIRYLRMFCSSIMETMISKFVIILLSSYV